MGAMFEALGDAETAGGTIRLWRRHDVSLGLDVYEVKLGDEYLMTSLFPQTEIALSRIGLAESNGTDLDVVVGGLGLGFTAHAALEDDRVTSMIVVDAVQAVIDWHEQELVPGAAELMADPRARLVHGDFFAMAQSDDGFDPDQPGRVFDVLLIDIDHTPEHHLDDEHGAFYSTEGLQRTAQHLRPGGVFAFWSDGLPIDSFTDLLATVFEGVRAEIVSFDNVVTRGVSKATIYVGTRHA